MRVHRVFSLSIAIIYFVLIALAVVTLYPFVYVVSMSLSSPEYVMSKSVYLLPRGFSLDSYRAILSDADVMRALSNSVWYTVVGTIVSTVLTCLTAYVLSRQRFFLRRELSFVMVITMFVSGGLIPLYVVVSSLGLYNTRWAIILPYAISTFNLIIARTYFESIPHSLEEAARIDGANDWTVMTQVILPLSKPIIAVLVLFYAVGYWNSYFAPLIFLADKDLQPIQLYLRSLLVNSTSGVGGAAQAMLNERLKYAVIVLAVVPIAIIYPFVQRYFAKGVMVGAVKE